MLATLAIALMFLFLLSAAVVSWRRKTNPQQAPPLHPAVLIVMRP